MLAAAVLVLLPAALTPQAAELVTRAAAVELSGNPRLEIISELDVQDIMDFSAQKQLCGGDAESCASQLAGAYDARLVFFLSLYAVGSETHVQLTLTDLKDGRVLHRADATGIDEPALFASVKTEARAALTHFNDFPAEGRVRLFISRAAISGALEAPPDPPSRMLLGGAVAGAGTLVAIGGSITGLLANGVVADEQSLGSEKDGAQVLRTVGYVGVGIGAAIAVAGVVLAFMGGGEGA